ncbi:hypothetical protein CKA32_001742 [Geitlerinema sp. FC II]|nr:hypothetical protein CKA32_001742 [Geitlerinema sp. FC II]
MSALRRSRSRLDRSNYQDPSQYSAYTAKRLGGGEAAVS